MRFCTNCGNAIFEGQKFCPACGTSLTSNSSNATTYGNPYSANVFTGQKSEEFLLQEEQEFLDTTHRILRWEQKAWNITGKVFIILGVVFAALFFFITFAGFLILSDGYSEEGGAIAFVGLLYGVLYGGMFLTLGIVQLKAAKKIHFYLQKMYFEFNYVNNRCGSVGMIVFCAFFGAVSTIFYIINFARVKANKNIIDRIIVRQNAKA